MGYRTDTRGITSFEPDDGDNHFYIRSSGYNSIQDIIERATEKWGEIDFSSLIIGAEHIHTDCIGYDLCDLSDYTDFLRIERK